MTRREFPKSVRREAFRRSNRICECHRVPSLPTYRIGCGRPLGAGNTFYEHIHPDGAGGEPTLSNCAALTKTCWRLKTSQHDQPLVAKVRRQADRDRGIGRLPYRPMAGTRRSDIKKCMDGRVVDRRTGQPWDGRA